MNKLLNFLAITKWIQNYGTHSETVCPTNPCLGLVINLTYCGGLSAFCGLEYPGEISDMKKIKQDLDLQCKTPIWPKASVKGALFLT